MALISCPECAARISQSALTCPTCGFPIAVRVPDAVHRRLAAGTGRNNKLVACIALGAAVFVGGALTWWKVERGRDEYRRGYLETARQIDIALNRERDYGILSEQADREFVAFALPYRIGGALACVIGAGLLIGAYRAQAAAFRSSVP